MSDLRQDPTTGQWVVISELRAIRPNEFRQVETRRSDLPCPFCLGFEQDTPPEVEQVADPGDPERWLVRVVPNKYPALTQAESHQTSHEGPYQRLRATGRQEIIIQSPRHVASFSQLTDEELFASIQLFQNRMLEFEQDPLIQHAMLFTNCRSDAGASLEHIHSQLIGTPILSPNLETRIQRAKDHFENTGRRQIHSILDWERDEQERIILEGKSWTAFCPFASRFPYQVWIAPKDVHPSFSSCDEATVRELGCWIREMVDRIERVHDFPAYNVMFHCGGKDPGHQEFYQWYVEIVPRLTRFAGYELGVGCWINHVLPAEAAKQLRQLPSNFEREV